MNRNGSTVWKNNFKTMQQDVSPAAPIFECLRAQRSHPRLLAGRTLLGNQPAGGAGWDPPRVSEENQFQSSKDDTRPRKVT